MSDRTLNTRKQPTKPLVAPTRPAPAAKAPLPAPTDPPKSRNPFAGVSLRLPRIPAAHAVALGVIAALALFLRMRDPLSSAVIGAEDPYLHMARTWDLVQGEGVHGYPIGFMLLLSPLTLLGPDGFYAFARIAPPLLGVISVIGVFFLCRSYTHPIGALAASLLTAVLPEHINRTNLLFPTAIDLAVLPFVVLALFRGMEGVRWGLPTAGGLTFFLFVIHPWVVALMLPPLALFFLLHTVRADTRKWAASMAGGSIGVFLVVLVVLKGSQAFGLIFDRALPQMGQLLSSPSTPPPLPEFVDLPWMLTIPVLLLSAGGAVLAVIRRTKLSLFALIWSLMLLPLTLVDWLGVSFLPHRTVVYLSLGLVVLAALPIAELARMLEASKSSAGLPATFGLLGVALILTVPAALAAPHWYRLYDDQDFEAWDELEAQETNYVMAGSWQSHAGYRSLTARDAVFMPDFFKDEHQRAIQIDKHPDMVVLVDKHTTEEGQPEYLPTEFLNDGTWTLVGEWGDKRAYERA